MKNLVTMLLMSVAATQVQADVWAEREALAKVGSEISALERLVNDASKLAAQDDRIHFNYDSLMRDLEAVRTGIAHHLSQPINPVMPSQVNGLTGYYTQSNK